MAFDRLLEILLPVLGGMPEEFLRTQATTAGLVSGVGQSVFVYVNQKKMGQFEKALSYEAQLARRRVETLKIFVDNNYVRSSEFESNLMQAIEYMRVADTERKISYIARALISCTLEYSDSSINKHICMRVLGQMSSEEIDHLVTVLNNPGISRERTYRKSFGAFVDTDLTAHLNRGLFQLGLLEDASNGFGNEPGWRPSILAEHLFILCRETAEGL